MTIHIYAVQWKEDGKTKLKVEDSYNAAQRLMDYLRGQGVKSVMWEM